MELTRRDSQAHLSNSCVRMVEQVSSVHDVGLLLQRMDIATCAAAERHTKVNCVTVAMGDVVVEHSPRVGELLTLTAEPVLVGRTSIDVSVRVSAEKGKVRRHVCDAAFTYVTTCVEINQCVGCTRKFYTKSFLGDDAAVLARSSSEEPASPRHRAGVASMAWRTTR